VFVSWGNTSPRQIEVLLKQWQVSQHEYKKHARSQQTPLNAHGNEAMPSEKKTLMFPKASKIFEVKLAA